MHDYVVMSHGQTEIVCYIRGEKTCDQAMEEVRERFRGREVVLMIPAGHVTLLEGRGTVTSYQEGGLITGK